MLIGSNRQTVCPSSAELTATYGTAEPPEDWRRLNIGGLAALTSGVTLRSVAWKGMEVARQVGLVIRDGAWGLVDLTVDGERIDEAAGRFELWFSAACITGTFTLTVSETGLTCSFALKATQDMVVNRAGLVLLQDFGGRALWTQVRRPDGTDARELFPARIAPERVLTDVAGLSLSMPEGALEIAFEGDVFEVEDQRNWTEPTFKTYSRPLHLPKPYRIPRGGTLRQSIRFTPSPNGRDRPAATPRAAGAGVGPVTLVRSPDKLLPSELVVDRDSLPQERDINTLVALNPRRLQVRIEGRDRHVIESAAMLSQRLGCKITLEAIVPEGESPQAMLDGVAADFARAGVHPFRVAATPAAWLRRIHPGAHTPEPDLGAAARCARRAFPDAIADWGILTNYAELNRAPPPAGFDGAVTHGTTAILHDAGDEAVRETLAAMPQVFAAAVRMAADYRLGLVAIGMRSNPYAGTCSDNPHNRRVAGAMTDPRHRGLFGAAYAVGAVAAALLHEACPGFTSGVQRHSWAACPNLHPPATAP